MIELGGLRSQTRFDVAQALAKGELRKGHAQVVLQAAERLDLEMTTVACDTSPERSQRQMRHELREHELAQIHRSSVDPARNSSAGSQNRYSRSKSRPGNNMNYLLRIK
jgi:hypothetical protein